jgi:hypothetical protein
MKTDQFATVVWKNIKLTSGKNLIEIRTADGIDSAEWIVK